jgi:3-methyladenine DNA glycosylase AlkD
VTGGSLLARLRRELARAGDPAVAAGARAYMKSSMPFHGVSAVPMRAIFRRVFADLDFSSAPRWRSTVLSLWREARFREERYAAIELSGDPRAAPLQTLAALPMYEEMIVTGAWWDFVDVLAKHRLGPLLARYPAVLRRTMLSWSRSRSLWKRRSAILCQLTFKKDTDLELLYACIAPSLTSPEFFLRKAIGWALRQYAWTDPAEVRRYVRAHESALSPLSRREALKNAGPTSPRGRSSRRPSRERRGPPRSSRR